MDIMKLREYASNAQKIVLTVLPTVPVFHVPQEEMMTPLPVLAHMVLTQMNHSIVLPVLTNVLIVQVLIPVLNVLVPE